MAWRRWQGKPSFLKACFAGEVVARQVTAVCMNSAYSGDLTRAAWKRLNRGSDDAIARRSPGTPNLFTRCAVRMR
jgi:hypothetical protein